MDVRACVIQLETVSGWRITNIYTIKTGNEWFRHDTIPLVCLINQGIFFSLDQNQEEKKIKRWLTYKKLIAKNVGHRR